MYVTGVGVSHEAIRLWWHSLAKFLNTLYTLAMFVYVDETKIKARNKTYILWENPLCGVGWDFTEKSL